MLTLFLVVPALAKIIGTTALTPQLMYLYWLMLVQIQLKNWDCVKETVSQILTVNLVWYALIVLVRVACNVSLVVVVPAL